MSAAAGGDGGATEVVPPAVLAGEEELALREVVRDLLAREAPATPAEFAAGDRRSRLWALAVDLGWPAIAIPAACEGLELGLLPQAGLLEAAGSGLFPGPLTTAAATAALLGAAAPGRERDAALRAIAGGSIVSFAALESLDGEQLGGGVVDCVPDVDLATQVVLATEVGGAPRVFLLPVEAADAEPVAALVDPGRPLFGLRFDPAAARDLGPAPGGVDVARALFGAELVGVAARALEVAIEHVRDRHQFGRPIGAFQAVKHHLADVYVSIERARSLVRGALAGRPLGRPTGVLTREAAMAKAAASEAALGAVRTGIQLTGALGTTAEHPLPWLFGRARSGAALLGGPAELYARLGAAARGSR